MNRMNEKSEGEKQQKIEWMLIVIIAHSVWDCLQSNFPFAFHFMNIEHASESFFFLFKLKNMVNNAHLLLCLYAWIENEEKTLPSRLELHKFALIKRRNPFSYKPATIFIDGIKNCYSPPVPILHIFQITRSICRAKEIEKNTAMHKFRFV